MNTRSLEQLQRLLTQPSDSEDEPAEGSLLWAAAQLRRIARMLEDDAALHRLLSHCGGLTLRIPRRFPAEGHLLRALLPEPALRRLLGAYGGTCLYIPRCARLARQVRQRELLGAFSRHTAAGTSSNAEVRFLARRYGITDRRVWQLLKQEAELPARALPDTGDTLRG